MESRDLLWVVIVTVCLTSTGLAPTVGEVADGATTTEPDTANHSMSHNGTANSGASSWGWWTKQCLCPIVVVVGVVGNSLTLVVMTSKNLRRKSYSQFLCALAVFDSASLVLTQIKFIDEIVQGYYNTSMFNGMDDIGCKIYEFFQGSCFVMSSWLVVALSVERVVAIYFPFKKATYCRPCAAIGMILTIAVTVMFSQLYRLVMIEKDRLFCTATEQHRVTYMYLDVFFNMGVLLGVLPITMVSISNSLVLWKIYKVHQDTEDENSGRNRSQRAYVRQRKTTRMLLTITFVYVATTLPTFMTSLAMIIIMMNNQFYLFPRIRPYMDFADLIGVTNYSINFFIYVLTGHKFRSELRYIFTTRLSSARSKNSGNPGTKISLLRPGRRSNSGNNV